jgi:glucose/arabinose dehydrogenase
MWPEPRPTGPAARPATVDDYCQPGRLGRSPPERARGFTITPIATDLKIPRQTLVLPNGDILIAEGNGGSDAPVMQPKDLIVGYFQSQGTSPVASGDRLTLLRDANGDGT